MIFVPIWQTMQGKTRIQVHQEDTAGDSLVPDLRVTPSTSPSALYERIIVRNVIPKQELIKIETLYCRKKNLVEVLNGGQ